MSIDEEDFTISVIMREENYPQPIEIGINLYEVDEETCAVEYMKLSGSMLKYQEKLKDINYNFQ